MNLYNEIDPYCAAWLRNLIDAGEIPAGIVDERSIEDIAPTELVGFTQCHFFAGLGGWPLALRRAGVSADRPLWTGSCPCQPFSAAGKGGGFADERHLWPAFDWLIGQCRPDLVLGEQVEGPAGRKWLDLVATDLEGHGYAFGTAVFPAAGVGAPQIRHRTYWLARAADAGRERRRTSEAGDGRVSPRVELERLCDVGGLASANGRQSEQFTGRGPRTFGSDGGRSHCELAGSSEISRLASTDEGQRGRLASSGGSEPDRQARGWQQGDGGASGDCEAGGVGGPDSERRDGLDALLRREEPGRLTGYLSEATGRGKASRPGPVNGFWRASDWLYCRDDKWRPTQSEIFPLASGVPARVGKLRAAGNAICVPQEVAFIEAVIAASSEWHHTQQLAAE